MSKNKVIFFVVLNFLLFSSCQSLSKKIDEKTALEEKELSKWLNKNETELKIVYGQPGEVKFLSSKNRNYIYIKIMISHIISDLLNTS